MVYTERQRALLRAMKMLGAREKPVGTGLISEKSGYSRVAVGAALRRMPSIVHRITHTGNEVTWKLKHLPYS